MDPPSFHDTGPIPISPYPGLSSAKHSKSDFLDGLIPKKPNSVEGAISKNLNYGKDINDKDDNDVVMDANPIIHDMESAIPTKSPATIIPGNLQS